MTEDKPTNEQNEQRGGAIPQDLIDRINELAHKKKDKGLTEEEQAEQMVFYMRLLVQHRCF